MDQIVHKIKSGKNPPQEIYAVIEIPQGSSIKYEIDEDSGELFVDRFLHTAMFYPLNYGFIPQTREEDGDPVDVLVLSDQPVTPRSVIAARPIGLLETEDQEGVDAKIIAVPLNKIDPTYSTFNDYSDLPKILQDKIVHFFEQYKNLEAGKWTKVKGWQSSEAAKKKISEAMERYQKEKA